MSHSTKDLSARDLHIQAWQAIHHYVDSSLAEKVVLPTIVLNFLVELGLSVDSGALVQLGVADCGYPAIEPWRSVARLYRFADARCVVYEPTAQELEVYAEEQLLMKIADLDLLQVISQLSTEDPVNPELTVQICQKTVMHAQAVIDELQQDTVKEIHPSPDGTATVAVETLAALALHRRVWSTLHFCVKHSADVVASLPARYVTFMVEVGRALASFPESRLVSYPDAVLLKTLYRQCQLGRDLLLSYNLYDRQLVIESDDPASADPAQTSVCNFSFDSVLGMLHQYETACSADTEAVLLATVQAAIVTLGGTVPPSKTGVPSRRTQVRLMTSSPSEPPPETAQIAAEMTMALWQSWGLDSQAVLGAVARAVEEALPVIEEDRVSARITRQRLMVERLNDYLEGEGRSKAIVKLPSAYADYMFTLSALYATFKNLSEEPIMIFEELHAGLLDVLAQQGKSDNWQAYYNNASSTLKLTTLLYPYQSRAIEQHLAWADARNAFVSIEPLLEADAKDSRWPVRVTVNAPWDFEIERLILDRFERRYKEAKTLDPISHQVLEALDPLVQAVFNQLKGGI